MSLIIWPKSPVNWLFLPFFLIIENAAGISFSIVENEIFTTFSNCRRRFCFSYIYTIPFIRIMDIKKINRCDLLFQNLDAYTRTNLLLIWSSFRIYNILLTWINPYRVIFFCLSFCSRGFKENVWDFPIKGNDDFESLDF